MGVHAKPIKVSARTDEKGTDWMKEDNEVLRQEQDPFPLVVVTPTSEGAYSVSSPIVPGLITTGRTIAETLENLQKALGTVLAMNNDSSRPLPRKFRSLE